MAENNNQIIIKKIKKGGHGHHGGAWKLAYADFVTAMMAFFLLMWLLGSTSKEVREGISEYFRNPWKASLVGGSESGDTTSIVHGGGDDLTRNSGQVKLTNQGKENIVLEKNEEDIERAQEEIERAKLENLKSKIEEMIETNPLLKQFENQLKLDITGEGLRIQIVDADKRPMFNLASARMEPYATQIIQQIAPVLNELENKISISGHTDARPLGDGRGYSNWELSADRANAARKELMAGGLKQEKFMRVVGLADSVHINEGDPMDPINRRISIIMLNKRTAESIRANSSDLSIGNANPGDALRSGFKNGNPIQLPPPIEPIPPSPLPAVPAPAPVPGPAPAGHEPAGAPPIPAPPAPIPAPPAAEPH